MLREEQHPSDEEVAAILLANGIYPEKDEPDEVYIQKVEKWLKEHGNPLPAVQIFYLRDNISAIRVKINEKLIVRNVLCGIGHFGKWGYTLAKCISKAKGWNQLVAKTAAYGPAQIAKLSFARTIASKSMWWITGIIATVEVGSEFKKCCKGQISIKQFFINSGKILAVNAASVVGGAGGAWGGASIGMACAGPVGAIVGAIIGGFTGSMATSYGVQQLAEYADTKYQKYTVNKLIKEALDFYQIPPISSLATLETHRKNKFTQYHPDKWVDASQEKQKQMAKKLQQTMEYYEILKNGFEARLELNAANQILN